MLNYVESYLAPIRTRRPERQLEHTQIAKVKSQGSAIMGSSCGLLGSVLMH